MGALISKPQLDKVLGFISQAKKQVQGEESWCDNVPWLMQQANHSIKIKIGSFLVCLVSRWCSYMCGNKVSELVGGEVLRTGVGGGGLSLTWEHVYMFLVELE